MNSKDKSIIKYFFKEYGSFLLKVTDGTTEKEKYCMRGRIDSNLIYFYKDWFDLGGTVFPFNESENVTVKDNVLQFRSIDYHGNDKINVSVTLTGYDPICDLNDREFDIFDTRYLERIIRENDFLVDTEYSGIKDGIIYCVLDLFRLGQVKPNRSLYTSRQYEYFYDYKANKLHLYDYKDTITLYHACKENNPAENWFGLWSVTKQEPLNRVEFDFRYTDEQIYQDLISKLKTEIANPL